MKRIQWLCLAAVGALGMLFPGCGPKVECDDLGKRLNSCTRQIMFELRTDARKKYEKLKNSGDKKKIKFADDRLAKDETANRAMLKKRITDQCHEKDGRAADAKLINECLEKKGCQAFARCFKAFLKEKSK